MSLEMWCIILCITISNSKTIYCYAWSLSSESSWHCKMKNITLIQTDLKFIMPVFGWLLRSPGKSVTPDKHLPKGSYCIVACIIFRSVCLTIHVLTISCLNHNFVTRTFYFTFITNHSHIETLCCMVYLGSMLECQGHHNLVTKNGIFKKIATHQHHNELMYWVLFKAPNSKVKVFGEISLHSLLHLLIKSLDLNLWFQ